MPATVALPRPPAAVPIHRRSRLGPVARWFLPALLLTGGVHAVLYLAVKHMPFAQLNPSSYNKIVPRAFNMKTVEIDPKLLDAAGAQPQPTPTDKPPTTPEPKAAADLQIPGEKPTFEQELAQANVVIAAPKTADQTMAVVNDKPKVDTTQDLAKTLEQNNAGSALPSDLNALRDSFLNAKPNVTRAHPSFPVSGTQDASQASAGPNVGKANFSNLDGLLTQRGPLTGGEKPILLPTDLLFDYDSPVLRADAAGSLGKLGQLIRQNPQATFTIEGHSDLFGSPEYNQMLSERRALSVKQWLAMNEGIDPARITTRGLGNRKPLVPGGSVEAQQINRRVEIVIHTNRK